MKTKNEAGIFTEKHEEKFYQTVLAIAVPVTLQSLLQSSFGVVDQVMTGQLGSVSIAGIGLASRFASIYSVIVSAIAAVAGIMIAQYMGKRENKEVNRSFCVNLLAAVLLGILFTLLGVCLPQQVMSIYTKDEQVRMAAAQYLSIVSLTFLPIAVSSLISPLLRCMDAAVLPLYAGICGALINTVLNYILIFGKCGFPALGVRGAAIATVLSQVASCAIIIGCLLWYAKRNQCGWQPEAVFHMTQEGRKQYLAILLPVFVCEFMWSLGENVYGIIYGHMGTMACAAMTLTGPIQSLMIGALTGISQASGVIIGKTLGSGEYDRAYAESKKLMYYGMFGSVLLSVLLVPLSRYYVDIYRVEDSVKLLAQQILLMFALISPVKVQNMITGGGIIRSGGKTKYVMWIDLIGTWVFGVPLGLFSAFVLKLQIPYVYLILSLEECVRWGICLCVFRKRSWMMVLGK